MIMSNQTEQTIQSRICETINALAELPEDFTYDYPLFDQFDGRPHLALSSLNALELVVLIYETWGIDVPMEDIRKLVSVNVIAEYLEEAGACLADDEGGRE